MLGITLLLILEGGNALFPGPKKCSLIGWVSAVSMFSWRQFLYAAYSSVNSFLLIGLLGVLVLFCACLIGVIACFLYAS